MRVQVQSFCHVHYPLWTECLLTVYEYGLRFQSSPLLRELHIHCQLVRYLGFSGAECSISLKYGLGLHTSPKQIVKGLGARGYLGYPLPLLEDLARGLESHLELAPGRVYYLGGCLVPEARSGDQVSCKGGSYRHEVVIPALPHLLECLVPHSRNLPELVLHADSGLLFLGFFGLFYLLCNLLFFCSWHLHRLFAHLNYEISFMRSSNSLLTSGSSMLFAIISRFSVRSFLRTRPLIT